LPEFRNPNLESQGSPGSGGGGGGDLRSLMTFIFLALAVVLAFQYFKPSQPATPPQPQQQAQQQAQQSAQPATETQAASSPATVAALQAPSATPAITAAAETETTVENEMFKIVFTNRGAQVKHWILKKDFDNAGQPLDLVQTQAAARFGLPLSLFTYEPLLTAQLNQALYQASATGLVLAPNTLTFHYAQNGVDVVKTFRFDSSYVITVEAAVKRTARRFERWWRGPRGSATWRNSFRRAPAQRSATRCAPRPTLCLPGRWTASRTAKRRPR